MVAGAYLMTVEEIDNLLPEHYHFKIGDLIVLRDGPDRGKIGVIVERGKVWSNLLKRHYPEYDVKFGSKLLRCMSGFYLEKIG